MKEEFTDREKMGVIVEIVRESPVGTTIKLIYPNYTLKIEKEARK